MNSEVQEGISVEAQKESAVFNNGSLSIRPAKKIESEYFMSLLNDVLEMLKDVKTSFSEEIVNERNS